MSKFRVGDRVKVNSAGGPKFVGRVGEVTDIIGITCKVILDGENINRYLHFDVIDLISASVQAANFKIGDHVSITVDRAYGSGAKCGDTGIITGATYFTGVPTEYTVKMDAHGGIEWKFYEKHLMPVYKTPIYGTPNTQTDPLDKVTIRGVIGDEPKTRTVVTIQDAIQLEIENKKPKYIDMAYVWHKEGKCPQCGELGRFHLSAPICSTHGAY